MSSPRASIVRSRAAKRHPAEVTAARLGQAVTEWHDKFEAAERDEIGRIIWALEQIADGTR